MECQPAVVQSCNVFALSQPVCARLERVSSLLVIEVGVHSISSSRDACLELSENALELDSVQSYPKITLSIVIHLYTTLTCHAWLHLQPYYPHLEKLFSPIYAYKALFRQILTFSTSSTQGGSYIWLQSGHDTVNHPLVDPLPASALQAAPHHGPQSDEISGRTAIKSSNIVRL